MIHVNGYNLIVINETTQTPKYAKHVLQFGSESALHAEIARNDIFSLKVDHTFFYAEPLIYFASVVMGVKSEHIFMVKSRRIIR